MPTFTVLEAWENRDEDEQNPVQTAGTPPATNRSYKPNVFSDTFCSVKQVGGFAGIDSSYMTSCNRASKSDHLSRERDALAVQVLPDISCAEHLCESPEQAQCCQIHECSLQCQVKSDPNYKCQHQVFRTMTNNGEAFLGDYSPTSTQTGNQNTCLGVQNLREWVHTIEPGRLLHTPNTTATGHTTISSYLTKYVTKY
eukprot:CAMPEP_0113619212 /NCGR_PEP_ID=MMETSP0017_2-20120614/9749_1 /TAXON_ID=2856 /ORGANISM="Cylindrotheca closterium" /LENGTH=197 /DNA_ID=CAMNT_0000528771 /DNA_START=86 /DNA_END=679 /DNA_ORIENTATION=- /assembly_acc=CAM_ASM_000147